MRTEEDTNELEKILILICIMAGVGVAALIIVIVFATLKLSGVF